MALSPASEPLDLVRARLLLMTQQFDEAGKYLKVLAASQKSRVFAAVGLAEMRMFKAVASAPKNVGDEAHWIAFFTALGEINSYRHDFVLKSGRKMFDVAKVRSHSPAGRPGFNFREWELMCAALPNLKGKRVLDIGAADGFFSVEAARAGADVVYLEPHRASAYRAQAIFDYYGVADRITVETGYFSERTLARHGRFDAAFALGLIYHLDNILQTMHLLKETSDLLLIETIAKDDLAFFDVDGINFAANEFVSRQWLTDFLGGHGYETTDDQDWREFCRPYPQTKDRHFFVARRNPSA